MPSPVSVKTPVNSAHPISMIFLSAAGVYTFAPNVGGSIMDSGGAFLTGPIGDGFGRVPVMDAPKTEMIALGFTPKKSFSKPSPKDTAKIQTQKGDSSSAEAEEGY
mgnify:CR=1 FL=1